MSLRAGIFSQFFGPRSYPTPPVAVAAIFAALLTEIGVEILIRVFTLIFVHDIGYTDTVIVTLARFTMMPVW
ncbi:MAG TPA: hypothetical protein VFS81_04045 [Candidatus Binatia bacterium]|nr:hypothetical protein [Candidatus Binatia bacterium]